MPVSYLAGGKLLLELDRLLRPGGYFVWSATPVYQKLPEDVEIWQGIIEGSYFNFLFYYYCNELRISCLRVIFVCLVLAMSALTSSMCWRFTESQQTTAAMKQDLKQTLHSVESMMILMQPGNCSQQALPLMLIP